MNDKKNNRQDLKERTKNFALRIINIYCSLPKTTLAKVLGNQVLRSGTSVGAHYREATRARSNAEFISKIEGGLQELEETEYWLELLIESGVIRKEKLKELIEELHELIAIFTASAKTAKKNKKK